MDKVWGQWQGDTRFLIHLPPDATMISGEGGPRPVDLVLAALLACSGGAFMNVLARMRLSVEGIRLTVDGERESAPPRVFTTIRVHWEIWPGQTPEGRIRAALDLAEKYCSISHLLRRACAMEVDVRLYAPGAPVPATAHAADPR